MKIEKQLNALIKKYRVMVDKIEGERRAKKAQKYVGRYFKVKSSYSPEDPDLWVYAKIHLVNQHDLIAFIFSKGCNGKLEIEIRDHFDVDYVMRSMTEITAGEFLEEWCKFFYELSILESTYKLGE